MKLLISTLGFWGHVIPASAFVARALAAGHDVWWHAPVARETFITELGATFVPFEHADAHEDQIPVALEVWVKRFEAATPGHQRDIEGYAWAFQPDMILADSACIGAKTAAQKLSIPFVELGLLPIVRPDPAVPLILQGCFSLCERPWLDAKNIHYCGPFIPDPKPWQPPKWFRTLSTTKPIILVTEGTMLGRRGLLTRITLDAMASQDCQVIALCEPILHSAKNVIFEPWVSLADVLPRCSALVTTGGYGTVTHAWATGVPIVIAGLTEEKAITANRVDVVSGTGINLNSNCPSTENLAFALEAVTSYPRFQQVCRFIANYAANHDGAAYAVKVLETYHASLS